MRGRCSLFLLSILCFNAYSQNPVAPKTLPAQRTTAAIKIDGLLNDSAWKTAPAALGYTEFRPTPFKVEDHELRTEVYMLYNDEGIFLGGYCHERTKDSIAAEVNGRDGFGNNDFVGFIFDTYKDKLNGFEYFVTPHGEQMDAKMTNNGEDFSWNAVWQSAAQIHNDGWSFEIFLPFAAIRFSKANIQDWGLNITRRRQKTSQQVTWNPIDPNVNGFLTQEGYWTGLENIKPPLRLQFSPYLSYYVNHYPANVTGISNWTSSVNGGMDLKYGINQAITLDMTLIPDFGQVQSDNRVLNLSPFEVRFNENRPFFTEGLELFNKGGFFYSRRVGGRPMHFYNVNDGLAINEKVIKNPEETKLINATKISGRLKGGLGIGFFNAVANSQHAIISDDKGNERKVETNPLTNYNIIVLDQTLKNNSSISFINTSVLRSGDDYDATVTAGLFDFYDKKNTWNVGGKVAVSNLTNFLPQGRSLTGYSHTAYFGKASGRFRFNYYQELADEKFNSNDLGYFTNNNYFNHSLWAGYNWVKPTNWYNRININFNVFYSQMFKPLTYQNANINANVNGQLKNLWHPGFGIGYEPKTKNFYEPRVPGRVFNGWGNWFTNFWLETNSAKKYSGYVEFLYVDRDMFKSKRYMMYFQHNYRFNQKMSISHVLRLEPQTNNVGFATKDPITKDIIFSRRDVATIENSINMKYSFNPMMVFTTRVRHYWSRVNMKELYTLLPNGDLQPNSTFTNAEAPNYNDFIVEAQFNWQFAPGSFINLMYKNNTSMFEGVPFGKTNGDSYFTNFSRTLEAPQNNNLSIRIIYFLDYLEMKKKLRKK